MKAKIILLTLWISTQILAYPGKVMQSFPTPSSASTGLTFDGKYLWMSDHRTDQLTAINPNSGEKQNKIFQIDPEDGAILTVLESPASRSEGLTWDGETLWLTDSRNDKILKIDLSDGTAVQSFPSPASYPQGLTWDGTWLWCADRIADEIHMIDPKSGEVILIMDAPGPYPRGLAFDGNMLWMADYQTDTLYQIIRQDEERFQLTNTRESRVTFTHEVKGRGTGQIRELNTYIAIPEDLPQQQIHSIDFSPFGWQNCEDRWNQWFAHYQFLNVEPETPATSTMIVETAISEITYYLFPDAVESMDKIPKEIREMYTANGSKYQTDTEYIQTLTAQIIGKETNPYWMARRIFDYVRKTLEYKLEGGWNIAPVVLERGTGSCSEYTFAFIALCRAAGIPARYVGAIVVRGDDASLDDVFHRWPEIYLPGYGWIPIDPQGGDKDSPRDRAMSIGHLSNRFLITTRGGGDSEYLGWYYNSFETVRSDPQVEVNVETFGEWEPITDMERDVTAAPSIQSE